MFISIQLYYEAGKASEINGQYDQAIWCYKQLNKYYQQARCYVKLENYKNAAEMYKKCQRYNETVESYFKAKQFVRAMLVLVEFKYKINNYD